MKSSGIKTLKYRMRANLNRTINLTASTATAMAVYAMLVAGLSSCGERVNVKEHTRGFEPAINYYHDCRTGLCFAEISQGNSITGHTCVSCDSVRKFLQPCR